jgi:hypothetical protein
MPCGCNQDELRINECAKLECIYLRESVDQAVMCFIAKGEHHAAANIEQTAVHLLICAHNNGNGQLG